MYLPISVSRQAGLEKVLRIKKQQTGEAHQQFTVGIILTGFPVFIDQVVQRILRELRVIDAVGLSLAATAGEDRDDGTKLNFVAIF